jgi:hypothetical protein
MEILAVSFSEELNHYGELGFVVLVAMILPVVLYEYVTCSHILRKELTDLTNADNKYTFLLFV